MSNRTGTSKRKPAVTAAPPAPTGRGVDARNRINLVRDVLPLLALLALVVYFSVTAEAFLTAANLTLISGQAGILLLASLGATLVIVAGSVDLSVGSIALLTGAVLASLINDGFGKGGFGEAGFGRAATRYEWRSEPLASGTWQFAVLPFNAAGDTRGTPRSVSVTIVAAPRPPAVGPDGSRLTGLYSGPTGRRLTIQWLPSPSDPR